MNKDTVAYGSIYLDAGEDIEKMTDKQIKSFMARSKKDNIIFVFFDIVGNKSQTSTMMAARAFVQQEVMARLDMNLMQVYVATTFKDTQRPARNLMMEYLSYGD